ncbi:MAG: phosphoglycerate kinase [Candidatus Andersenbacteria bacterium]|nr:phosphoglycerate kinase [Candidatus Andersenbacteria bacterium]
MKSIKEIKNLKNKKVLVRVDFNVPVGDDGIVDDKEDWRIKAVLPTIKYLIEKEARVILMAHLGRPGKYKVSSIKYQACSLKPVAVRLEKLLNKEIKFIDDCVGDKVKRAVKEMLVGEIVLLENLRFYKEEKENDEKFAKELAGLADIYINDAFSVSHRAHASVSAITKFMPSYAGLLLEKEINILSKAIDNPKKSATIIIGGAKAETKFPVIKYLIDKFDHILVGGVVANVILKAKGIDTGKSLLGDIDMKNAEKIDFDNNKLYIPVDAIICNSKIKKVELSPMGKIGDEKILDIGNDTAELFLKIIADSKTIIWNGPMGMFEKKEFSLGTQKIAKAVVRSKGYTIIGGGDTIAALDQFGYINDVDYICTGGGAMLEFLAGKELPGLDALE